MNAWPGQRIVMAALRGMAEVFKVDGVVVKGVRSAKPWIVWTGEAAVCLRCRQGAANPPPVELDKEKAILATGPQTYALHVLAALLHPFYKAHEGCGDHVALGEEVMA